MKKSSLAITGNHLSGQVIHPAKYEFSQVERMYLGNYKIEFLQRAKNPFILCNTPEKVLDTPKVRGLASRFARLATIQDIDLFASQYGMLGVKDDSLSSYFESPSYGNDWYEPLNLWFIHIVHVRRLMKIYRTLTRLKKGYDVDISELFYFKKETELSIPKTFFRVLWHDDGLDTGVTFDKPPDEETAAVAVLTAKIKQVLNGGISLDFSKIIPAKDAAIGFRIAETRTTPYLLAAIYYDLWELITDGRPVEVCGQFGLPLERTGRRGFCNNACKQAAYRKRAAKPINRGG
jgi:hypothetical protein